MPSPISAYEVRFAPVEGGEQTATLRRVEGAQAAETGAGGTGYR